jgi:hypothetical protein
VRLLVGVVAGPDHGANSCMAEAHVFGTLLKHLECVWVHVPTYRNVVAARRQVLAYGEHVYVVVTHVLHDL